MSESTCTSCSSLVLILFWCISGLVGIAQAQVSAPAPQPQATNATTDPSQVRALNSVFEKWQLHENKREGELVDSRLSEFNEEEAKRIIKIGLLCTQTSPMLRPSMSRVVGMLSGDMEVTTITSKPGYLTDWKFDDITTVTSLTKLDVVSTVNGLATDMTIKGTEFSFNHSSASTSIMGQSPPNAMHSAMLQNDVDGR